MSITFSPARFFFIVERLTKYTQKGSADLVRKLLLRWWMRKNCIMLKQYYVMWWWRQR